MTRHLITSNHTAMAVENGHTTPSPQSEQQYGIFFPEDNGPGHLLIRSLASGCSGDISKVYSIADHEVVVRKQEKACFRRSENSIQSLEVRNVIAHPSIPRLISYREYNHRAPGDEFPRGIKTSSNWDFCNGGTLEDVLNKVQDSVRGSLALPRHPELVRRLPEAFIYKTMDVLLTVLEAIHGRGVVHQDLHHGNIFLHWSDKDQKLPDIFVGDFGNSERYPGENHPDPNISIPFRIASIYDLPDTSREDDEDRFHHGDAQAWYNGVRKDWYSVTGVAKDMVTVHPFVTTPYKYKMYDQFDEGMAVNGFSQEVVEKIVEMKTLLRTTYGDFEPASTLVKIRKYHAEVKELARKSQADFETRYNPERDSLVSLLRPAVAEPRPATWTTRDFVHYGKDEITVTRTEPFWSVRLDRDDFEIRKVTRHPNGRWSVLDREENSEGEDIRQPKAEEQTQPTNPYADDAVLEWAKFNW